MCFDFLYLFWDSPFSLINDLLLLKFQEAREVLFHDGNHSIDLQIKSIDWFLYDRVKSSFAENTDSYPEKHKFKL